MPKRIDYYMSLISPWTYLGNDRLTKLASKKNAVINIKPINLGLIFPETGGLPLAKRAPARKAYRMQELRRWQNFLKVPINFKPAFFPANEWPAAGMVISAKKQGLNGGALLNGFLTAVWAEDRNIANRETMLAVASEQNLDGLALLNETEDSPEIGAIWETNSKEALAVGVFGAPTYVIDSQLFWGQDRLEFVERALDAE